MTKERISLTSVKARKSLQLIILFTWILKSQSHQPLESSTKINIWGKNNGQKSKTFLNLKFLALKKLQLCTKFLALYGPMQETLEPAHSKDIHGFKNKDFKLLYYWARRNTELANLFLIQSLLVLPHKTTTLSITRLSAKS